MPNQLLMLEKITMDYHAFRQDQVLTDKQLNRVINYFEDQDRLTRTCLTGVGLVCGLGVNYKSQEPSIKVNKGCAVTTDGDLVVMEANTYRDFRAYTNRKKGNNDPIYDPFFPNGDTQMKLWELVTPNSQNVLPADAKSLGVFAAETGKSLDDLVLLLYLEYYLRDPDQCTAIDCDNQGPHQVADLKVLLLSKEDMQIVINRDPLSEVIADSIYTKYHDSQVQYFNLALLKAKRVVLNALNTASVTTLAKAFSGIVHDDGNVVTEAVEKLYNAFKFIIDPSDNSDILQLKQSLHQNFAINPKAYQAQYLYDFYKDIITCYNELRELLFHCMYECCPDKYAFPKHIMLGELKSSGSEPVPYRHEFYPSPAVTDNKEKIAKCRSMWQRMQKMIRGFNLFDQPVSVKITPSSDYDRKLEHRAIPFYYKNADNIVKDWNYSLNKRSETKSILSYHANDYAAGVESSVKPLDYNIDSNNFFRVEGHLGKSLNEAMGLIDGIKTSKSVPFDVVAVRLDKAGSMGDINIDDFDCQFDDLNAVLKAWIVEQDCLYASVTKFFSGFTNKRDDGFHVKTDDFRAVDPPVFLGSLASTLRRTSTVRPSIGVVNPASALGEVVVMGTRAKPKPAPICKTIYTVDKTVNDNLETSKAGSLGGHLMQVLRTPVRSADEVIAEVKRKAVADPDFATLTVDEKEVVHEIPLALVSGIYEISSLKPFAISEINEDVIEKYIQRMEKLCKYVKTVRVRMETVFARTTYVRRGYETYYILLLQQLIANCCAAEKLETILEEIEKRKKKILESLLFGNYANQHPGLEHKAGVHRGGTLVLVYVKQRRVVRKDAGIESNAPVNALRKAILEEFDELVIADATAVLLNKSVSTSVYKDLDSFAYYLVTNQDKINFDDEVDHFLKVNKIPSGIEEQRVLRLLSQKIKELCSKLNQGSDATVADNVVVADFCLPYLCCSDCPPMTFVVPAQQFALSLPKSSACSDDPQMEFRKDPVDGTVKASPGFENTVLNDPNTGRSFFVPANVTAINFGKEISFTINDQVTDCRILVLKHPTAKFSFEIIRQDDAVIVVKYINQSDDDTGSAYVYDWNLNDGGPVRRVTDKEPITITYKKDALEARGFNGKIPVSLVAANGSCTSSVFETTVPYEKPQNVELQLPQSIVCKNADKIRFSLIVPEDGLVASPNEPASVSGDNTNGFFFEPGRVATLGTPVSFTVNSKPTNCRITVLPDPDPQFRAVIVPGTPTANIINVNITNTTDPTGNPGLSYTWVFNDGTFEGPTLSTTAFEKRFLVSKLRELNQTEIIIVLKARNAACEHAIEKRLPIPTPEQPQTCGGVVVSHIETSLRQLSADEIRRLLNSPNEPNVNQLKNRVEDTRSHLEKVRSNVDAADAARLLKIKTLLLSLYRNNFSGQANKIVITVCVNALLKLALDITRCKTREQMNGDILEVLAGIINEFKENVNTIKERMPGLNKGSNLTDFQRDYINSTVHRIPAVIDKVGQMMQLIIDAGFEI